MVKIVGLINRSSITTIMKSNEVALFPIRMQYMGNKLLINFNIEKNTV